MPATRRSDIYSLGVLLYRLVTRRYPVDAATFRELEDHHRAGRRVPIRDLRPDLPGPFVNAVERALDPDPERRFASVGEMERELAKVISPQGAAAAPWWKGLWARHKIPVLVGACLAVVAGYATAHWRHTEQTPVPKPNKTALAATAFLYREHGGKSELLMPG